MSKPKFIITRFTHGAAGKFLSTVLQTSDKISHWSALVQSQKNTTISDQVTLEYVKRSFPKDHSQHLRCEPMVPYNTDLYSAGYPRGTDVTLAQYIKNAELNNDTRLLTDIKSGQSINLIFHHPYIPIFCHGATAVTITVTTPNEKDWLYKTLWSKHFLETLNDIHYLPSDPEYCNFQSLATVLRFNNQYRFSKEQKQQLYHDYVINDHTNSCYFNPVFDEISQL